MLAPHSFGRKLYQLSRDCNTISHLQQILAKIITTGAPNHRSSLSALISFSATSPQGDLRVASFLFAHIRRPNAFAYNSLIQGLVNARCPDRALLFYLRMGREGPGPDKFTFPFVLKACALLLARTAGKAVHGKIWMMGFSSDVYIQSGLIRMYSEFSEIDGARRLFDEVVDRDCVLWNSMMGGYVKCCLLEPAVQLFEEMPGKNIGTYNAMLGGFVKLGHLDDACKLFEWMPERDAISWNTMIGANARLGSVMNAMTLFLRAPERHVTTWSAIISGFAQSGQFDEALKMFNRMLSEGVRPNQAILVGVLSSCAQLGALEQGIWIHGYIGRIGIGVDDFLGAALIDMYSKCGLLDKAVLVFQSMEKRGVCSWTSMVHGFAIHGHSHKALATFNEMENSGIKPNAITFVAVLSACSHAGLVPEGREIFLQMENHHGIGPTIEHYTCMVDILSRADLIEEAQELIKSMPMEPDIFVWGALLGGSRIHGRHCLLSKELSQELAMLERSDSGAYVLVSNIYSLSNQWEGAVRIRSAMTELGVKKNPGCSMIEVDHVVHEFLANGRLHPNSKEVYEMLGQLYRVIKVGGPICL